jgi:hypothetical protein
VIPALGRWRQENQEFKVILGYIMKLSQKKEKSGLGVWFKW